MTTPPNTDLVNTIHGPMNPAHLRKEQGATENDNEKTTWTEYWLGDALVHRSVHMELKQALFSMAESASL